MDDESLKKLRSRMNRAAEQVTGIRRMLDEDRQGLEILAQIAAVRSALDALAIKLLTKHLESRVFGLDSSGTGRADARPMTKDPLLDEVRTVLARFLK